MPRPVSFVITAALFGLAAVGAYRARTPTVAAPVVQVPVPRPVPSVAAPRALSDPLAPSRPAQLEDGTAVGDGWVSARPGFQYSKSAEQRGGIEPCATQSVDASGFADWLPFEQGKLTWPKLGAVDETGGFDLVIHFHGDEPVRRELILSDARFVLYAITLGPNRGYGELLNAPGALNALRERVTLALAQQLGRDVHAHHVLLSAWSAGFTGVAAALAQDEADVEAVVLIDGLHAPRADRAAFQAQLAPFLRHAKRAASEQSFFLVTHSSIDPPDFASTTECAHYLEDQLQGRPISVRRRDALGLELVEMFDRGNFHVRGYAGNDKADHCAQLATLREAYAALGRYWAAR